MKNRIITLHYFTSRYKKLNKKYTSLTNEFKALYDSLLLDAKQGESIGSGLYKIRLAVASKGAGKSGGLRIITYLVKETKTGIDIYLITIYDKSDIENIDKSILLQLIKDLPS